VLSEFAGELPEALSVNPYAIDEMAATMERALTMAAPERSRRMTALRERVALHDVNWWTATFLSDLWSAAGQPWPSGTAIALAI
jgi:trehalose 6-phosphate synthase